MSNNKISCSRPPRPLHIALLALVCCLPSLASAQAGSSAPITLETADDFYASLALLDAGHTGSGGPPPSMRPRGILKLPESMRHLLWVELDKGLLHLLEQQPDGGLITRRIVPVSIGKNGYDKEYEGDKRTPIGVYRITSFLADQGLDDFYGLGAYPLNYPNARDRRQGRTGSGIWLHGLPKDVSQRPLLDSDGCVVIDNASLLQLAGFIDTGSTHIILSEEGISWQPLGSQRQQRETLELAFDAWRRAWEAIDNEAYLSFYAKDFSDFSRDFAEWSDYKRRVNNAKSSIEVRVSDLSFLADPRRPDLVTVRYYQRYRSSNYEWDGWKEQLWRQSEDGWEIVYEGNG